MDISQTQDGSNSKKRLHANTVTGARPPALDISLARPASFRRNSEGSPGIPPIEVMEPTPIDPSADNPFNRLSEEELRPASIDCPQPYKPNSTFKAEAKTGISNSSAMSLLDSGSKKKNRSRASSLTSNLINEIKENPTIQKVAGRIRSRHSWEEASAEKISIEGSHSAVAPSSTSTYDLASVKRNQDFHSLFRSVPEEDSLIEDYGCALQKEILLQGRIYLSETHVCFNANIFGWVTNLVIAFTDIVNIEKKATAYFIPNAIQISTDSAKYFFASFLSRDQAYDLITEIWHNCRPDLFPPKKSSLHSPSENELSEDNDSEYDSDDSFDEDENEEDEYSTFTKDAKTNEGESQRDINESPQPSIQSNKTNEKPRKGVEDSSKKSNVETSQQKHEETNCECENHYPNVVLDIVYNGSVEKIYKLLFHDSFLKDFLIEDQKSTELSMGEWQPGENGVVSVRELSYIKPLNNSLGPKSTKCYLTQEVVHKDFDDHVTVLNVTNTPDVPSGSAFSCKTRTCFTWAGKQKVRVLVTVSVEFTKSSWLKSTIEKASIDGQQNYYKELDAALRTYFKEHPSEFGGYGDKSGEKKRRRKHRGHKSHKSNANKERAIEDKKTQQDSQNFIASALDTLTGLSKSFSLNHMTLLCLIVMVIANLFIARKMTFIEQQLGDIYHHAPSQKHSANSDPYDTFQKRNYNSKEERLLWELLNRLDPEKPFVKKVFCGNNQKPERDDVWDSNLYISKTTKEKLDRHINELSNMIQNAGNNLKGVTDSIELQGQRINKT